MAFIQILIGILLADLLGGVPIYGALAFPGWKCSAWFLVAGWSAYGL